MLSSQLQSSFLFLPFTLRFLREQNMFLRIFLFSFSQLNSLVDVPYTDLYTLNSKSVAILKHFSVWIAGAYSGSQWRGFSIYFFSFFLPWFTLSSLQAAAGLMSLKDRWASRKQMRGTFWTSHSWQHGRGWSEGIVRGGDKSCMWS